MPLQSPDPWDAFGCCGAASILAGVAAIYWPAALILAGIAALTLYYLREITLVPSPPAPEQAVAVAK